LFTFSLDAYYTLDSPTLQPFVFFDHTPVTQSQFLIEILL